MLLRSPGFTVTAVLTLALGLGANTAVFSLVNATLLRRLPFRDPGRLIAVSDTYLPQYPKLGVSPAELSAWQEQHDVFEQSAWYRAVPYTASLTRAGSEPAEVHATFAPAALFAMLGVHADIGRCEAPSDPPNLILLSHRLWVAQFGGDPAIMGKPVRFDDQAFTVAGVMPATFAFPEWADAWLPPGPLMGDELTNPVRHAVGFIGRLRQGVTEEDASSRLATIAHRLAADHPQTSKGWGTRAVTLQRDLTADIRPTLLMLLGAVAVVLLIACANIANLLLARASGRSREIAIRTAVGAGLARIVRQLLTESILLALLGGAAGLAAVAAASKAFPAVKAGFGPEVLLFTVGLSTITGVLFGLAPALGVRRLDPVTVIKSGAAIGGGGGRIRTTLVVAEFALVLVLLIGAGLLVKSLARLMHVDPGFDAEHVLTLRVSVPPSRDGNALFQRMQASIRSIAGVESVAVANTLPLEANRAVTMRFNVPGNALITPDALPAAGIRLVSPDYFSTMRIPVYAGRVFTERDLNTSFVIINAAMARRFWPGQNAIGQKFVTGPWGPTPTFSTVIGVVGDVRDFGLDSAPAMDIYFPSITVRYVVIRTTGEPVSLAAAASRKIHAPDPDLPVSDVRTMADVMAGSARSRRRAMLLLNVFAGLALALALIGIYGLMSGFVAQRTREIGVRMALGAPSGEMLRMVLRQASLLCLYGSAIGIAISFAMRRVLAAFVFEVSPADLQTYAIATTLMVGCAVFASWVPARRASRVDPLIALRWE